jgi:hypothetical protein
VLNWEKIYWWNLKKKQSQLTSSLGQLQGLYVRGSLANFEKMESLIYFVTDCIDFPMKEVKSFQDFTMRLHVRQLARVSQAS